MDELDVTSSDKQYPGCYFLVCRGIEAGKSGIEGILSRLEKQRNRSFGLDLDNVSFENNEDKDEWDPRTTTDTVSKYYPLQMLWVVL